MALSRDLAVLPARRGHFCVFRDGGRPRFAVWLSLGPSRAISLIEWHRSRTRTYCGLRPNQPPQLWCPVDLEMVRTEQPRTQTSVTRPTWQRLAECPQCVAYGPNLRRTVTTALIVGTVLFVINHLVEVVDGRTSTGLWISTGVSFIVPFCVANIGLLFASRRRPEHGLRDAGPRPRTTPTWCSWSQCPRCIIHPPHLTRTLITALIVGTLYFAINQMPTVTSGQATTTTWVATGLSYLVPFCVSNVGVLVGCRQELASPSAA